MTKVFLHIGLEKTGTTSIQAFLSSNRSFLIKQGVLYPKSPGESNHIKLTAYAIKEPEGIKDLILANNLPDLWSDHTNKEKFIRELTREIHHSRSKLKIVIFSNEHCSSRLKHIEEITEIKKLLDPVFKNDDLKIVLYLRRQDHSIVSNYNTVILNGNTLKFNEYFKRWINSYQMDNYRIIKNWESVFGKKNLIIRIYQCNSSGENSIIRDFMASTSIAPDRELVFPKPLNTSLDIYCLEFLRNFNSVVPFYKNGQKNDAERGNINNLLAQISGKKKLKCNAAQFSILKEKFQPQNERIVSEYSVNNFESFLYNNEVMVHEEPEEGISSSNIDFLYIIASKLWIEKEKQIIQLNNQKLFHELNIKLLQKFHHFINTLKRKQNQF